MNYSKLNREEQQELIPEGLERLGFKGVDVSTDISLFEYGLLIREVTEYQCSIQPTTFYQVLYVTDWAKYEVPLMYDIASITEGDIKDIFNEDWFESEEVLKTCGITEEQFFNSSIQMQLSDMLSYYGYENIFGSSYYPMYLEDLINWIESELKQNEETE